MTNTNPQPLLFKSLEDVLSHIFKIHAVWVNDDISIFELAKILDELGYKIIYRPEANINGN